MRTTRLFVLVASVAAHVAVTPNRAEAAVRSGTIVAGTGHSPANPWVRGMEGCVGAPSCSAWLQSGCAPALARERRAVHAAILDVRDLADTDRFLGVWGDLGINWGGVMVQFWTRPGLMTWDNCTEIGAARSGHRERVGYSFHVPADATWMTISSSSDNTSVRWKLW